jgi:cytochrome c-type biogenesis protein CcmH
MAAEEDVKQRQIIENRARNISHNVRCTECGSQSIEDSQADVAILLRKVLTVYLFARLMVTGLILAVL